MHCAGFSCAASPSSGLGHLKIHGRLKQETATQSGCYATDEGESTIFLTSKCSSWIFPDFQTWWETPQNQCCWSWYDASAWGRYMWVWKIVKGMCVALFDQMVEKATIVLYPVVESIKALTVCYIRSLKAAAKVKHLAFTVYKSYKAPFYTTGQLKNIPCSGAIKQQSIWMLHL